MANCLAGRRGDTARVIAENLAVNLQARIDRGRRKTREAGGGARDEAGDEKPDGQRILTVSPKVLFWGAAAGMIRLLMDPKLKPR